MPQPIGRDLEQTRRGLDDWLAKKLPEAENLRIEGLRGPKDTGFSSDTLMFDLLYDADRGEVREPLVVRLEPAGEFGIFPGYDVSLQHDMMHSLTDTPVPAPRMIWLEEDRGPLGAPFYVMERLDGLVPSDSPPYHTEGWIHEATPEQRRKLWFSGLDAMCDVHRLDWQRPEFAFLARPDASQTPLQAQLQYWDEYMEWGLQRERYDLLARGLAWLRANTPAQEPTGICWGDSRISNQIFRDFEVIAVIDWEMVFLGNPEADLAWFITLDRCFTEGMGIDPVEGWPGAEETIAHWEQRVGRPAAHYSYYEFFAAWRFSCIMARLFCQMKYYEIVPQDSSVDVSNLATNVLERLAGEVGA